MKGQEHKTRAQKGFIAFQSINPLSLPGSEWNEPVNRVRLVDAGGGECHSLTPSGARLLPTTTVDITWEHFIAFIAERYGSGGLSWNGTLGPVLKLSAETLTKFRSQENLPMVCPGHLQLNKVLSFMCSLEPIFLALNQQLVAYRYTGVSKRPMSHLQFCRATLWRETIASVTWRVAQL